jgi:threonine dehydratase
MIPEMSLKTLYLTRESLPNWVRRTPLLPLPHSEGISTLHLKAENLQVTGAYKVRAAYNVVSSIAPERRMNGIVLASSGNFAQAFALVGRSIGIPVIVVMLDATSPFKIEAARQYGAEVVFCGTDALARQPAVEAIALERGMAAIDTWEDPAIAIGHASIGIEILEDFPEVETVLVPVSSGGGAGGIAAAIKESNSRIKVVGVQPQRANAAYVSLKAGQPTVIDYWDSIADGLSAVRPGYFPFQLMQKYLDEILLVSEQEIADAMRTLLFRGKLLAEPAGAVASAAFLSGHVDTHKRTVALLTGGNVTSSMVQRILGVRTPEVVPESKAIAKGGSA